MKFSASWFADKLRHLSSAEGGADDLLGLGSLFELGGFGLLGEGFLEDGVELVEGLEVVGFSGFDDFLDAMVTRDEDWVAALHEIDVDLAGGAPVGQPGFDRGRVFELRE